jgi:hypothetical protein
VNYIAGLNLDRIVKKYENPEVDIMADNNQIAILSQGVEAWNKWRKENPDVLIDLKSAKLMHMNLEEFLEKKYVLLQCCHIYHSWLWGYNSENFNSRTVCYG